MLKEIKYESHGFEDIILDLANEIENGWRICGFRYPEIHFGCDAKMDVELEVTLNKES